MFKHLLFASDLAKTPETAFAQMLELAVCLKAEVTLFHAYDLQRLTDAHLHDPSFSASIQNISTTIEAKAWDFLAPFKQRLDEAGLNSEVVVSAGHAGATIINVAGQRNCDLIVMGSRGLGPVSSLLLSSQSTYVLHHSHVPVLVLPHSEKSEQDRY